MMKRSIYIGWDPREKLACEVARYSLLKHMSGPIPVRSLVLQELQDRGLYTRPTHVRNGRLVDELSIRHDYDGSISTEHANARFLVMHLAREGWAMFCDGDFLFRADVAEVFNALDPKYAVYCVKHHHAPAETMKMDGQIQTRYYRKNWSSLMFMNCAHPANSMLTLDVINTWAGRDLHAFGWLADDDIGALDPAWNYLVGTSKAVHFTAGTPDMAGYESCAFADEWRATVAKLDWSAA